MVKYTAEQTLTSNNPPEIAGEPIIRQAKTSIVKVATTREAPLSLLSYII